MKTIKWLRILFSLSIFTATGAYAEQEISMGVLPYISAGPLIQFHTPLKNYISKALGQPINLITAPDFESFFERTKKGEYDIIFTAPHFARVAEQRDGYKRVVMTSRRFQGLFLTKKDSPIQTLDDLKDKKVMIAQRISMLYQLGEQVLQQKGLIDGKNVTIIETRTHNNALYAPLRAEADASVTGLLLWNTLDQEFKDQLKVIATTTQVPGFLIFAHSRLPLRVRNKLESALIKFGKTPEGIDFFEKTGFVGFEPITDKVMLEIDPYTKVLTTKP